MAPLNSPQESAELWTQLGPRPDAKHQVERILAQEETDSEIMYLVKWKDYDDRYCTWELAESFETPNTISTWQEQLARGDTLNADQVEEVLARMDAFRSQQAELSKQSRPISGCMSGELERRNTTESKSAQSSPRPSAVPGAPPKVHTAIANGGDSHREKVSAVASNPRIPSAPKNFEAPRVQKRRLSSTGTDEQLKKAQRSSKGQKIASKYNQPPPPIGLIKPSEIEHREPGHHLPATSNRDSLLFGDNRETPQESIEASESPVRSPTIQVQPSKKDSFYVNAPQAPKAILARSIRLNPTDLVVRLSVGSRKIGPVTLSGLPIWLRDSLLSLKDRNPLALDFKENWVLNWQQYQKLSSGWLPPQPGLDCGTVHPLAEAEAACSALAQHLEESDSGATWIHPKCGKTFVLVLHASTLSHWRQNSYRHIAAKPRRLLVAVRNRGRKGQPVRPLVKPPSRPEAGLGIPAPAPALHFRTPATGANSTDSNYLQEAREDISIPADLNPDGQDMPHKRADVEMTTHETTTGISNQKVAESVSSKSKSWLEAADTSTTTKTWDTVCDLDYRSMTSWKTNTRPFIYIAFGSRYPNEAQELAKWATQHTAPQLVFVEGQGHRRWEEFRKRSASRVALVLFSGDAEFCNLPSFGSLLGKYNAVDFVSCRLSWQTSNPQLPKYRAAPIFNHGTALLLTEAAMKHTAEALKSLDWFRRHSRDRPNEWRIMVRPNIRAWLTRQAVHATSDDSTAHYLGMLAVLSELMPCVDVTEPDSSGTNKSGLLEKMLAQTARSKTASYVIPLARLPGYESSPEADEAATGQRDEVLLDHFVGWSALHVDCHRRFLVLDGDRPKESQTPEIHDHAHHIVFMKVTKFARDLFARDLGTAERHKQKK
ncbi:hypothetical protein DV735_g1968, partial [Chaetothyriales sp. CBS 134920]